MLLVRVRHVRFEVITVMLMKIPVLWYVVPWVYQPFEIDNYLHLLCILLRLTKDIIQKMETRSAVSPKRVRRR